MWNESPETREYRVMRGEMDIRVRGKKLINLVPYEIFFVKLEAGFLRGRNNTEVRGYASD